jgi:hypothetical protein
MNNETFKRHRPQIGRMRPIYIDFLPLNVKKQCKSVQSTQSVVYVV